MNLIKERIFICKGKSLSNFALNCILYFRNKLDRPKLEMGIGPDVFLIWQERWSSYKRLTGMVEMKVIKDQLMHCCSEMLQTSSYSSTTEDNLIKEMKKYSVPHHSNLVSIVQLRSLPQEREEHRLMLLESTTSGAISSKRYRALRRDMKKLLFL